jgi:putative FmdB family regulatory protein
MPTYDYQCQACGHTWEMFQSMNANPTKSCPKCKKRKAKRLLGVGAGLIFKGTGFYETDYKTKSGSEKKEGSSDSGPSDSSKSPDSSKSSEKSSGSSSDSSSSSSSSSTKKESKKSSGSNKTKR